VVWLRGRSFLPQRGGEAEGAEIEWAATWLSALL